MAFLRKHNLKLYTSLLFGFIASVSITLLVASTILH